jgi:hypothetical protein
MPTAFRTGGIPLGGFTIWGRNIMSSGGSPFDFSKYTGSSSPKVTDDSPSSSSFTAESNIALSTEISFGDEAFTHGSRASSARLASAPVQWLFLGTAIAAVAIFITALFGGNPAAAISAWVLGGPVAIAFLAFFTMRDTRARTFVLYSASELVPWLYGGTLLVSSIAVVMSALRIADWVGRL